LKYRTDDENFVNLDYVVLTVPPCDRQTGNLSQAHVPKRFTISEVAADWHELIAVGERLSYISVRDSLHLQSLPRRINFRKAHPHHLDKRSCFLWAVRKKHLT